MNFTVNFHLRLFPTLLFLVQLVLGSGPRADWVVCLGGHGEGGGHSHASHDDDAGVDQDHVQEASSPCDHGLPGPAPSHDHECACTDVALTVAECRVESLRGFETVPDVEMQALPAAFLDAGLSRAAMHAAPPVVWPRFRGSTVPRGLSTTRLRL